MLVDAGMGALVRLTDAPPPGAVVVELLNVALLVLLSLLFVVVFVLLLIMGVDVALLPVITASLLVDATSIVGTNVVGLGVIKILDSVGAMEDAGVVRVVARIGAVDGILVVVAVGALVVAVTRPVLGGDVYCGGLLRLLLDLSRPAQKRTHMRTEVKTIKIPEAHAVMEMIFTRSFQSRFDWMYASAFVSGDCGNLRLLLVGGASGSRARCR